MRYYIIPFRYLKYILSFLLVLESCSHIKQDNKNAWIGKELIIPEIAYCNMKIIIRFEGDCPACVESIGDWEKFYYTAKKKNPKLKLIFYVEVIREEFFKDLEQKLSFADDVIFDQRSSFFRTNLLKYPFGIEDQTFLLNEKNEILVIGNPVWKKELISKYLEKL